MTIFSVIIATRDRPALFKEALASVLAQTETDKEIVVINDGSKEEHRMAYEQILGEAQAALGTARLKMYSLVASSIGHGPSFAMNYGVSKSLGEFIAFLDDDDLWTDPGHLARARSVLAAAADSQRPADTYMAHQDAYLEDRQVPGPLWLGGLADQMRARGAAPAADGSFSVGIEDLLAAGGFCHTNCLIVRRDLYNAISGMDAYIRWESDRDLFLRLIDKTGGALFHPALVSRHRVPPPSQAINVTTGLSMLEKRLFQLRVTDKAALFARHGAIRAHGRRESAITAKKIADELAKAGRWQSAAFFARRGFAARPSFKWGLFTAWCHVRQVISGDP